MSQELQSSTVNFKARGVIERHTVYTYEVRTSLHDAMS